MLFKFKCEICSKDVKRGPLFDLNVFQFENKHEGSGYLCFDQICKSCATKIERKVDSMRGKHA